LPAHNVGVSSTKRREITEKDVVGLKYFSRLTPVLTRLHPCGCVRDKAENRTLSPLFLAVKGSHGHERLAYAAVGLVAQFVGGSR
jgi:hypothetical protein